MDDHKEPEEQALRLVELFSVKGPKKAVRQLLRGSESRPESFTKRNGLSSVRREPPSRALSAAYNSTLDRAEEFARRVENLPPKELRFFKKALRLLRSGKGVVGLAEGRNGMLVAGLGVYEALLARSWDIRYDNPQEMWHLANVAKEMAESFDPAAYGVERVADLQARAWGELANAYRVADRIWEARVAFGTAFSRQQKGSGDRRLLMRLLDLEASFLGTVREYEIALRRLAILAEMYRKEGDYHMVGRTLVTKALYTFYKGQPEQSLQMLSDALELIDKDREPVLLVVAAFNELLFLVDCDRCKEARRSLFAKRTWLGQGGHVAKIKLRWIEGRIAHGLGEFDNAEMILREAKAGLEETKLGFACALAGLDLAITLMRQNRRGEAYEEALQSAEMFIALSIHHEILSSVVLLKEALLDGTADVKFLEAMVRYLRRKLMELGLY